MNIPVPVAQLGVDVVNKYIEKYNKCKLISKELREVSHSLRKLETEMFNHLKSRTTYHEYFNSYEDLKRRKVVENHFILKSYLEEHERLTFSFADLSNKKVSLQEELNNFTENS